MDVETAVQLAYASANAGIYFCNKNKEQPVRPRRTRRWWVRPIYMLEARESQGTHNNLLREMRLTDPSKYTKWMRMTPTMSGTLPQSSSHRRTSAYETSLNFEHNVNRKC